MPRPLWTCPQCGHRFVTRNMWHSCGRYSLRDHFRGRNPLVRGAFERFLALARSCGPVTCYAQKTRIVIHARVRFAGGVARKYWFNASLWLTRKAEHPCLRRIENPMPGCYVHHFRLTSPADVDRALGRLVREAYVTGLQGHLEK